MCEESPKKKQSMNIAYFGSDDNYRKNADVIVDANDAAEIEVDEPEDDGLKIVHLNDACLEKIFRHLNLVELTNVAEANGRLAVPAKHVFAQVHENHRLFLRSHGGNIQIPEWHPLVHSKQPPLTGPIMQTMFRHFGKFLRKIKVLHTIVGFKSPPNFNLVNLIAEYCNDTLVELECFGQTAFSILHHLDKPFVRLEKLIYCEIVTIMSPAKDFNKMFPNLRFLEFHNVSHASQFITGDQQFPYLEHFGIYTFPYAKFEDTHIAYIEQIVQKNPQIKSLSLYDMKLTLNKLSLKSMPSIERLEIGGRHSFPREPFQFGNLKSLKIICSSENESNDIEWRALPPQLERLEIVGFEMNERVIDLVSQCKQLKSLAIMAFETFDLDRLQCMTQKLPHLEQVEFISKFKEDHKKSLAFLAALKFMQHCPQLHRAIATIHVDKEEARYKINKWTYTGANEFLQSYRQMLEKTFTFDWWRWSIKHEVRIIDYLKGWKRGTCFRAILEKSHNATNRI